jgi:hypothetical protein
MGAETRPITSAVDHAAIVTAKAAMESSMNANRMGTSRIARSRIVHHRWAIGSKQVATSTLAGGVGGGCGCHAAGLVI